MKTKKFIEQWSGRGYEKGETQSFWLGLLRDVLNVDDPENYIKFEVPVKLKHTNFIDAFLPATKIIIEQKSLGRNLNESAAQSDGDILKPYEQAQRYGNGLPYSMRPRWIIVCNFAEFLIYDMETLAEPEVILLANLDKEYYRLQFLIDNTDQNIKREVELSIKAGEIVGKLYDALHEQYINPDSDESLKSLNKLCVRLVFCLYAESTGIFGKHKIFRDYLSDEKSIRRALINLFEVLNTPINLRDPYLEKPLSDFPYVNGGLFNDDRIEIPNFTDAIRTLLLEQASSGFNWSDISPTIFGAVFESTLNPVTRRAGGMHYTSIENIHKVIDPLFLNDLRGEFENCNTKSKLREFQNKLASLKFFDPACGSGNFLTETYLSLRRLENDLLKKLIGEQVRIGEFDNPVKVSISQFYGIEINDFAVTVAKTALWIAESQMIAETSEIVHRDLNFLPLKTNANICEDNALRIDWRDIAPSVNYIMGNPPFVGHQWRNSKQVDDMKIAFHDLSKHGKLDYVCAWYNKAADFIDNTKIECAFVSTNSICQGESVGILWRHLFGKHVEINFAHRTFQWESESTLKARVHCVVIGFAKFARTHKFIFDGNKKIPAQNINGYLMDAPNIFIENRGKPPAGMPKMTQGSTIIDNGNLILSTKEREDLIANYPFTEKFIRPYIGAEEFINGKKRYCLWLVDANPAELHKCPPIIKRLKAVHDFRLKSVTAKVREAADTPALFTQIRQPNSNYLVVPAVSSERRKYIPIGYLTPDIIASNQLYMIPDSTLYIFGVLFSIIHMAWCRVLCGRLDNRYRYSPAIYNNFPWCDPSDDQRRRIESTADEILKVLAKYPDSTLADLYDELTMPIELRRAHRANDAAVMALYGFNADMSEEEIVAGLMKKYSMRIESKMGGGCDLNDIVTAREFVEFIRNLKYFYFGVMTSSVHMSWMRTVCGRLKSDYRYSPAVYNNFPWYMPSYSHCRKIICTAQNILNVREKYPDATLADLYDESTMPPELRRAHRENDRAVMAAYGFNVNMNEAEVVAALMRLYRELTR